MKKIIEKVRIFILVRFLMSHLRSLVAIKIFFLSSDVLAVWDYSLEFKVAIYQASVDACIKVDKDIVIRGQVEMKNELGNISQKDMDAIKSSDEYVYFYAEGLRAFLKHIESQSGDSLKLKACKEIMRVDGYGL